MNKNIYYFNYIVSSNEVIVNRVMMYANPLLVVQAMYFTFKGQSVFYSFRGVISENILMENWFSM